MQFPSFFVEQKALSIYSSIAGVDEVGRGCLSGPVVAGIVLLTDKDTYIHGVRDSKQLTPQKRTALSELLKVSVTAYGLGIASAEEIDTEGIVQATHKAMLRAYWNLPFQPEVIMMDGEKTTKPIFDRTYQYTKGDERFYSIAAASIIAKVYRDNLMNDYALQFPEYDFENNKGYGTNKHVVALKEFGITPIHRKSFLKFLS